MVSPGLGTVVEGQAIDVNEGDMERGRLFVKVVEVKDLDLPLPSRKFFSKLKLFERKPLMITRRT